MAQTDLLPLPGGLHAARIESLPFGENTYVVFRPGTADCLVVDPGFEPDAVVAAIEKCGLEPRAILLTHGHSDHIAGNGFLRERWPGLPILIGRHDAPKLTDPEQNLSAPFGLALTSPPADRLLDDGETLDLAGLALEVREIPGHSRGHVVFVVGGCDPPVVIGGDVLFHGSVGRTDFPDGDAAALAAGIRGRLYTLPDDTLVLPGHGPPTTVGHERRHNPFVPDRSAPAGED
jgi:hydroxyacylglutathione hydrolase